MKPRSRSAQTVMELQAELDRLREENERLKSRGIEDMQWEIARLREALNELGEYIRRGRGSDYAAMREILDRDALKETT